MEMINTTSKNWFGLSDYTMGIILLLTAALVASVDNIMLDVAEDNGVSANAMTLYASICTLLGSLAVDAYYWWVGYGDGVHWFVFIDIWSKKQREKFFSIETFWQYVLLSCVLTYFITISLLAAYVYVSDVADSIAIYDGYPIFVPIFGLCFKATGEDWKHRYFISLLLIIIGILFVAQPGFIFGYSNNVNTSNQLIGCILSLISSILTAFATVAWVMTKKLAYLDLLKQQSESETHDTLQNTQPPETMSLKNNDFLNGDACGDKSTIDTMGTIETKSNSNDYIDYNESNINSNNSNKRNSIYDKNDLRKSMTNMMLNLAETHVLIQSNEYIIQNDWAFSNFFVEYYSVLLILQCILFSPLSLINTNQSMSWFWDEFTIAYQGNGNVCLAYTIGASILWYVDSYLYFLGTFKVINAPVVSIMDVSDIVFTYITSYIWLNEIPDTLEIVGSLIVVLSIVITVYPMEKLIKGTKYEHYPILKNF